MQKFDFLTPSSSQTKQIMNVTLHRKERPLAQNKYPDSFHVCFLSEDPVTLAEL